MGVLGGFEEHISSFLVSNEDDQVFYILIYFTVFVCFAKVSAIRA